MNDDLLGAAANLIIQAQQAGESNLAVELLSTLRDFDTRIVGAVIETALGKKWETEPVYAMHLRFVNPECGGKIAAIKAIRAIAGLGLREAKDASETFDRRVIEHLTHGTADEVAAKVNEFNSIANYKGTFYAKAEAVLIS